MIAAIELCRDGDRAQPFPWQERRGLRVYHHGLTRGCLLRPLANVTYFMPPYVITPDEIRHLVSTAREGVDRATAD
jgi:adenosylmethionine-8-amino-7-oxononanoate aminotransferase